jgi:hypothetical protein
MNDALMLVAAGVRPAARRVKWRLAGNSSRRRGGYRVKTLAPPSGLTTLKQEMDRLFDRFWGFDWPELPIKIS